MPKIGIVSIPTLLNPGSPIKCRRLKLRSQVRHLPSKIRRLRNVGLQIRQMDVRRRLILFNQNSIDDEFVISTPDRSLTIQFPVEIAFRQLRAVGEQVEDAATVKLSCLVSRGGTVYRMENRRNDVHRGTRRADNLSRRDASWIVGERRHPNPTVEQAEFVPFETT